jgi:predicted dehydrogenase
MLLGMKKLRAGIIGLGSYGLSILKELDRNENFVVRAIADRDPEVVEDLAQQYHATPHDDYRSLIVEENLDVLFLTLPTFLCKECVRMAAREGIHVFKEAPLARTLPEAMEMVKMMEKADARFHVGARKRFSPGYLEAHKLLTEKAIGQVYLIRAEQFLNYQGSWEWRGDPVLAGGGVLLEMAYHLIDQIVWSFELPERVFCQNNNFCAKRVVPPYRTEDSVILNMQFSDGAMANLVSSWMTGPESEKLIFHGVDGTIEVSPNHIHLYNPDNKTLKEVSYDVDQDWLISQQVRHFADMLLDDQVTPTSTARQHLANVAVVESAYLSARTLAPETLKVYGELFDIRKENDLQPQ